jgi:hypothetical protein
LCHFSAPVLMPLRVVHWNLISSPTPVARPRLVTP